MDQFIGSLLGMSVHPSSNIAHYWNEKDVSFITAQKFAIKTGLRKNRWEHIRRPLTFWEGNAELLSWKKKQMNGITYDSFSNILMGIFIAGSALTIDESMIRWLGDKYYVPGITKVKLKPKGVGFLIKGMSDSQSKVILHIELQEKPENIALKNVIVKGK